MPRDGAGTYSAPAGTAATTATTIESAKYNAFIADLTTDANGARPVVAGGTGASSASAARTALAVPGAAVTATISGAWTFSAAALFTASPKFNDGVKAVFGTGSDLEIYHDGTDSVIKNNTGILVLQSGTISLRNAAGSEVLVSATADGAATLFYDNSARFATSAAGVTVTGRATVSAGQTLTGGLWMVERADHQNTPTAASGEFWVKSDTPNVPVFTDDAGTDHVLASKAYVDGLALGVGQSWQDVSGSRAHSTTYQNSTGRPIQVAITLDANSVDLQVSTNGTDWVTIGTFTGSDNNTYTFIVPSSHRYRVNGPTTVVSWVELR